jgi:hypothetical protein
MKEVCRGSVKSGREEGRREEPGVCVHVWCAYLNLRGKAFL